MNPLERIRSKNKKEYSILDDFNKMTEEHKKIDYSNYEPTKEELEFKEKCITIAQQTLSNHATELWGDEDKDDNLDKLKETGQYLNNSLDIKPSNIEKAIKDFRKEVE